MIIQLEKESLYSTFSVDDFSHLDNITSSMSPSMVEYYLSDLSTSSESQGDYINRSNIQQTIYLGDYSLFLDYDDNIFLEFIEKEDDYETQSLW
ncbi:MAG: hypothetical protein U9R16_06790 [Campylobacterota bacterium]|nr:hypothetical protein [Campylobacterota bacterium]